MNETSDSFKEREIIYHDLLEVHIKKAKLEMELAELQLRENEKELDEHLETTGGSYDKHADHLELHIHASESWLAQKKAALTALRELHHSLI